jgi:hypothetical protein
MGRYTLEEAKAIASFLKFDNLSYVMRAPVYAHKPAGLDGRLFYGEGMIQTEADLAILELPDPYDDSLYAEAEKFVEHKDEYAAWFVTRIGIFPTMLSMGIENFCIAVYENRSLVEAVLDRYCDWMIVVAERICQMGFDVLYRRSCLQDRAFYVTCDVSRFGHAPPPACGREDQHPVDSSQRRRRDALSGRLFRLGDHRPASE